MPRPETPSKAELLLKCADRIKLVVDESVEETGIREQLQFFGPPVSAQAILMRFAYDRRLINQVLELMPEPTETVRPAFRQKARAVAQSD
jgi:hypothetical protein